MWKGLTVIAALVLAGAGALSYLNMNKLAEEKEMRASTDQQLSKAQQDLAGEKDSLEATKTQLAQTNTETESLQEDNSKLDAEISKLDEELISTEQDIAELDKEIARINRVMDERGDPQQLIAEMQEWQQKVTSSEGQVVSLDGSLASAERQQASIQTQIEGYQQRFERRRSKEFATPFSGRIQMIYPEWGFVVINAGGGQGMVRGAEMAVVRGGAEVARLKVTNVERGRSVADIVAGSLAEGQTIETGDLVVAVMNPEPAAAPQE